MEDKELKKKLSKIPDADKNGDPIYKITDVKRTDRKSHAAPKSKDRVSK